MARIEKTFVFPKIAFYGSRRINTPEITMELRDTSDGPELSICGEIWNSKHTDRVMCGQCLDEMKKFKELRLNSLFKTLHRLWELYHLNSCHPGTIKQEDALKERRKNTKYISYEDDCDYLESIGLLFDSGYKYGSSWLYREIPKEDMSIIESLLNEVD